MAQVAVSVGGMTFSVGCQDGEEDHLHVITQSVSQRLEEVQKLLSPEGEKHALFLTALLLADDLYETKKKIMTEADRATLEKGRRHEELEKETNSRLHDAADMADSLLQQVEDHIKTHNAALGKNS